MPWAYPPQCLGYDPFLCENAVGVDTLNPVWIGAFDITPMIYRDVDNLTGNRGIALLDYNDNLNRVEIWEGTPCPLFLHMGYVDAANPWHVWPATTGSTTYYKVMSTGGRADAEIIVV